MTILNKANLLRVYLVYRIAITLFAVLVVSQFTSLGDSGLYLESSVWQVLAESGWKTLINRTALTKVIVSAVRSLLLGSALLTHLFFNILAYLGIKMIVDQIKISDSRRYIILVLLLVLPSFNIWSSIAGKEAIIVFSMGVLVSYIIRYFNGQRLKLTPLLILSIYLITVIKIQYMAALIQIILYIKIVQKFKIRSYLEIIFILLIVAINVTILYIFRDAIDQYSRMLIYYFRAEARSTRESPFIRKYDFFRLLPYGMFISLWGPTLEEMRISILHTITFIESFILFVLLFWLLKGFIVQTLIKMAVSLRQVFLTFNTLFWLFFAQYVQGIMNPGSAVRYRTNFYLLLILLVYYLYNTERKKVMFALPENGQSIARTE